MANITNQKGVLILDAAADNIVPAGTQVKVIKARLVGATAAGTMRLTDAGSAQGKIHLGPGTTNFYTDEVDFGPSGFVLNGLRLLDNAPTGGALYVYTK